MNALIPDEEFIRITYLALRKEFGEDFFKQDTTEAEKEYTAKDIVKLPAEQVDAIQRAKDKANCHEILKAFKERRINQEETSFLLDYYRDGMSAYREVYRGLYEIFGRPEHIACMNPDTGELETHVEKSKRIDPMTGKVVTFRENVVTDYSLQEVTPFTCMRLEYRDAENNPVNVILPVMKKPARAIEKILDYRNAYMEDVAAANSDYKKHGNIMLFQDVLRSIKKPHERVNDVLRLTVTRKYYSGVAKMVRTFSNAPRLNIDKTETRSLFYENSMDNSEQLSKNKKSYFDVKMFFHLEGTDKRRFNAEAQVKIDAFYKADLFTHHIYEEERRLSEFLDAHRKEMKPEEINRDEYQIRIRKMAIQKINKEAIHEYNMQVLDKIRWLEDGYRALRIPPDNEDGTYNECRKLINADYMVRPFKAFDDEKEFSPKDADNIRIAGTKKYNLKQLYEISRRYKEQIATKYRRLHNKKVDSAGNEHTYSNIVPGKAYDSRLDRKNWDDYGKAKKFRSLMNKNIYKDNYAQDYWQTYDQAENEVEIQQKTLTDTEIKLYHESKVKKAR